jgi:hypothetical protein
VTTFIAAWRDKSPWEAIGWLLHVRRDASWKSGAGGFALIIMPSLDLVISKWAATTGHKIRRLTDCRSN